ncbi:hypothetical protein ACFLW3_00800 [Chloroflexota bacterium]
MVIWHGVKKVVYWLLVGTSVLYLVTGFGITQFRTVEAISFGWLSKGISLRIHNVLWIPFLVLMGPYIFLKLKGREKRA